jgi:transposase
VLVSPDALLYHLRRSAAPLSPTPRVLGIDDFAFRKGRVYGTILIDLERHCPVDLLPDREADTVASWLKEHPGVEVISRDRGNCYKGGATKGAPEAMQVADRWHLIKNLGDTLESLLQRQHRPMREIVHRLAGEHAVNEQHELLEARPLSPSMARAQEEAEGRHARREARYERVRELYRAGFSQSGISRQTGLSSKTIRTYLQAQSCPHHPATRRPRPTLLAPFVGYLRQRWEAGCHNASALLGEIQAQGYRGQVSILKQYLKPWHARLPTSGQIPQAVPSASSVRWWLLGKVDQTDTQERFVTALLEHCLAVKAGQELAEQFLRLVRDGPTADLDGWLQRVQGCGVPEMQGFAKGLISDKAAVEAALSLRWSNGQTEGQVNRLKFLKRQMYGRASFGLLKARVLPLAA